MKSSVNPSPLVSVIIPVFNGEKYLEAAISSILNQTYRNIEVIIINDGSSDSSEKIIHSIVDKRIIYKYQKNQGLSKTLNTAIKLSRGEYIVRQDQDDISLPERVEKQLAFLIENPEISMVGCGAKIWREGRETARSLRHPCSDSELKIALLFDNFFIHSSIMLRKKIFDKVGFYSESLQRQPPEDYELWSRVVKEFPVANMKDLLVCYREVGNSMSRSGDRPFLKNVTKISLENQTWVSSGVISCQCLRVLVNLYSRNYGELYSQKISFLSVKNTFDRLISLAIEKYDLNFKEVKKVRAKILFKIFLCFLEYNLKIIKKEINL